ncbi:hypothetical protein H0H87_001248, partial [Tephrocybe sp. NHM501043]
MVKNIPDGWSSIKWWGVNNAHYHPIWASLACDYLSIMASSVSSEHTFFQGGLTVTMHHNHLKGDIVEALQSLKYAIQHDLLFREPRPSTLNEYDDDEIMQQVEKQQEPGWDELLSDDDDDNDS